MTMKSAAWLAVLLLFGASTQCHAQAKSVAGRSLLEWSSELSSKSRTRRLRAALTLPSFGAEAVVPLVGALEHADPGVVYWSASGLGDLAHKSARTKPVLARLKALLKHKSIGVRLAAGFALCRLGETRTGLAVLTGGLQHAQRGVACAAADFLARIGPPAAAAVPALQQAAKHSDYHVKGAANEALKRIRDVKEGK